MVQLIGVLVPLAVAVLTTLRWQPSLDRRIRAHVALLKELPDGVDGAPIRDLLSDELTEQAERDRRRLDTQDERVLFTLRIAILIGTGAIAMVWQLTTRDPTAGFWQELQRLGLYALSAFIVLFTLNIIWWTTRSGAHRIRRFFDPSTHAQPTKVKRAARR